MALNLKSDAIFGGITGIPARAPLPDGAVAWVDFLTGLHITQSSAAVSETASSILTLGTDTPAGYYYGAGGLAYSDPNRFAAVEYGNDGLPLGLLLRGGQTQLIIGSQRQDLTAAARTGATVAASGAAAAPWAQWYALTPTGAGEASIAFGNNAITMGFVWWCVDVVGSGVVQLGAKSDTTAAIANYDLSTGDCVGSAGTSPAMVRRADGSWTLVARLPVQSTPNSAYLPYVASVADLDTGRLGASGAPVLLRSPRLSAANDLRYEPPHPWSSAAANLRDSNNIRFNEAVVPPATATTIIAKFRAGWYPQRLGAGLFVVASSVTGAVSLAAQPGASFVVSDGGNTQSHVFQTAWEPEATYDFGVSLDGATFSFCLNGETCTFRSSTVVAPFQTPILGRGSSGDTYAWGGHIQKIGVWQGARSAGQLAALCDRWL